MSLYITAYQSGFNGVEMSLVVQGEGQACTVLWSSVNSWHTAPHLPPFYQSLSSRGGVFLTNQISAFWESVMFSFQSRTGDEIILGSSYLWLTDDRFQFNEMLSVDSFLFSTRPGWITIPVLWVCSSMESLSVQQTDRVAPWWTLKVKSSLSLKSQHNLHRALRVEAQTFSVLWTSQMSDMSYLL